MSHGHFASGILNSLEMIIGKQDNIDVIQITDDSSLEGTVEQIENLYKKNNFEDTVIICDILGGTPSNASLRFLSNKDNILLITGMNLPMLLELFMLPPDASFSYIEERAKHAYDKGLNIFSAVPVSEQSDDIDL